MPRKKNSKTLHPPKSPLIFAESPREIPHKYFSPIQCCAFPIAAQSTLVHDCDFLWVSPQFTNFDELPHRKIRRKCKQKVFVENENATPHKKYTPLKFVDESATESPISSSSSSVTRSKHKRTAFQDCQPVIQVQNVSDISISSDMDETLKVVPSLSYLQSLFETTPPHETNFGDILVPDTPETDSAMTVREKQKKNMNLKMKAKYSI